MGLGERVRNGFRHLVVGVAVSCVCAVSTAAAAAASPSDDAREAARQGTAAYNLGAYEEAAKRYEEAYRLVQDQALLFNIGQSWRLAGNPDKALTAYRSYLRTAPPDAPTREQAERRVVELENVVSLRSVPPAKSSSVVPRPASSPAMSAPAILSEQAPPAEPAPPMYRRWWFWTAAGAIAATVVITAVLLSSGGGRATTCGSGVDFCAPVRP